VVDLPQMQPDAQAYPTSCVLEVRISWLLFRAETGYWPLVSSLTKLALSKLICTPVERNVIINVACTQPSVSSYSAADDLQPAFWDAAS
jgi:hypothetical protein